MRTVTRLTPSHDAMASMLSGEVMTTRRRVLLGSGGLTALAPAGPASAETPTRITGRNAIMEISESALPMGARGSDSDSGNHGSNPGPQPGSRVSGVIFPGGWEPPHFR